MKTTPIAALLALLCAAPLAFAQDPPARDELPESEIAATIESDSRELLELFVDWASVVNRVHAEFDAQDRDDLPPEFTEWANTALRGLTITANRVDIPNAGEDPQSATAYADMVYQVFYEGPYRDFVLQRLAEQQDALERDMQQQELYNMQEFGGDPEHVLQTTAVLRQDHFQLELERAEAQARASSLDARLKEAIIVREQRSEQIPTSIQRLQELARAQQDEVRRLQDQKEKLGTREVRDITAAQSRLMEIENELAAAVDEWRVRQDAGGADLAKLRDMLMDSQTHLYALESRMRVLQQRLQQVEKDAAAAREMIQRRYELETQHRQLQRTLEQVHQGRLFGLNEIPTLKFRQGV